MKGGQYTFQIFDDMRAAVSEFSRPAVAVTRIAVGQCRCADVNVCSRQTGIGRYTVEGGESTACPAVAKFERLLYKINVHGIDKRKRIGRKTRFSYEARIYASN